MSFVKIMVVIVLAIFFVNCVFFKNIAGRITLNLAVGRKSFLLKLIDKIVSRMTPKTEDKITKRRENGKYWIQTFKERQEISIVADDGVTLVGHYLKHPEAKRIVVMFHGWRGSWDGDFGSFGKALYERKSSLLLVEQRAHGRSGGKYIGFGVKERYDCKRWVEYIAKQSGNSQLPIYLAGVSMGAATVLMATELQLPKQVKGVIADCGFTTPYEMVRIFAKKVMKIEEMFITEAVNRICKKVAGYSFKECSTLSAMRKCKIPVFFVHGTNDNFVPYEMSKRNFEACRAKKYFLSIEGADHVESFLVNPKQYMNALEEFFLWKGKAIVY